MSRARSRSSHDRTDGVGGSGGGGGGEGREMVDGTVTRASRKGQGNKVRKAKPKFSVGQVVFDRDGEEVFAKVLQRDFDPCDGWEYDIGDRAGQLIVMRLENQLRELTARERGRKAEK